MYKTIFILRYLSINIKYTVSQYYNVYLSVEVKYILYRSNYISKSNDKTSLQY